MSLSNRLAQNSVCLGVVAALSVIYLTGWIWLGVIVGILVAGICYDTMLNTYAARRLLDIDLLGKDKPSASPRV